MLIKLIKLGINISEDDYLMYLSKLGFNINKGIIEVPSFRSDVKTQNDLSEEVAVELWI